MKICVLGCGAYGSALATILNKNGNDVIMWTKFDDEALAIKETRECPKLPGVKLDNNIEITTDIKLACENASFIVLAIPTGFVRSTLEEYKDYLTDAPIVIASKGIEQDSCLFVNDIVEGVVGNKNIAVISGPSFAIDVANEVPVGLTLACENEDTTSLVMNAFCNDHFKLRVCDDIIGTEICGSIKNVIAIASGILDGMGMPESTSAMFITESLHDIKTLIKNLGGNEDTILSFAGIGDLLLTATSSKSRNYSLGYLIGSGASQEEIENYISNTTIEGLYTLKSIKTLIENKNINMLIIDLINEIIYGDKESNDLVKFIIKK